jgi:hypothetical protein
VVLTLVSVCPIDDLDTPWYLRAGERLLASRSLPAIDPFSWSSDRPWLNHEYLAEVLFAAVHRAFGWAGLGLLQALGAVVPAIALAWGLPGGRDARAVAARAVPLTLAALFLRERLNPRAILCSISLFAWVFVLCARAAHAGRASDRASVALVALGVLWTQFHGGNPDGVALVGALFLARPSARHAALTAAMAAATCVGPFGPAVHRHFLDARSSLGAIREWTPWHEAIASGATVFWVVPVAVLAGFAALELERRRGERVRFFAIVLAVYALITARWVRFAPQSVLVGAGCVATALARHASRGQVSWWSLAACALAIVLGLAGSPRPMGVGWLPGRFPEAATTWLRTHAPPGRMVNSYNFGGYLLWAWPERQVFIDGRAFTVYSNERLRTLLDLYVSPERFDPWAMRNGVRLAVLQRFGRSASLVASLRANPAWSLVYLDAQAAIFVRRAP